ncbi:hypothetical protein B0A55_13322 [Friedmanniomyces simplex]|uniref:Uncharacterized protein n=1 Tax=Friedmanniomyces simplex TaxID=329884 RepID=A0A4U0VGJ5_9PEZI|nr:hypothetical protein B0A55_13322 [Friedmanniomyces simplex]
MDLGRLHLVSTTSGLQLELSSLAQFNTSIEDVPEERLTMEVRDESRQEILWIKRANNFRLVLGLRLGNAFDVETKKQVLESLATGIRDAKAATSVESTASDTTGLHLVTISLAYCERDAKQQRRCMHKLGVDVPFYDVKPPACVQSCALEVVHLAMNVTLPPKYKRAKFSDDVQSLAYARCSPSTIPVELSNLPSAADILIEEDNVHICDPDSDSDSDDILLECYTAHLKRPPSLTDIEPVNETQVEANAILELIDAAIRLAISERSQRLGKTIRVRGGKRLKRLRDVAPTIWSPDYLPSVADRAVFLPTISHALRTVASKTSHNMGLRRRLAKLCPPSVDDPQTSLSAHLWRMLQEGEYASKPARRLKPLFTGTKTAMEDDMDGLATLAPSQGGDEQFVEYEDEFSDFEEGRLNENDMYDDELLDSMLGEEYDGDGVDDDTWTPLDVEADMLDELLDSVVPWFGAGLLDVPRSSPLACQDGWNGRDDEGLLAPTRDEPGVEGLCSDWQGSDDLEAES